MDYVMLGQTFDESIFNQNPLRYLVSEKLDGQRCLYIRSVGRFFSRLRNEIYVPSWWKEAVDKALVGVDGDVIDGELYIGPQTFEKLRSIVSRTVNLLDAEWRNVRFVAFDVVSAKCMVGTWGNPQKEGIYFPNEGYYYEYKDWLARLSKIEDNEICQRITFFNSNLESLLAQVKEKCGEGLMLRDATVTWRPKRGPWLMKLKPFITVDAEIIAIEPGVQRGAIWVRAAIEGRNRVFKVGTGFTDDQFRSLIVGSIVPVAYRDLSNAGVPKETRFVG